MRLSAIFQFMSKPLNRFFIPRRRLRSTDISTIISSHVYASPGNLSSSFRKGFKLCIPQALPCAWTRCWHVCSLMQQVVCSSESPRTIT